MEGGGANLNVAFSWRLHKESGQKSRGQKKRAEM